MVTEKRKDGWWITDGPEGVDDMGPYDTKKEADSDRVGVARSLATINRKNCWVSGTKL